MRKHLIKAFAAVTVVGLAAFGCSAPDFGVILQGLSDPDESCVYKPSTGTEAIYRAMGTLDLKFLESSVYQMKYYAGVTVNNYLQNSVPQSSSSTQTVIPPLYINGSDVFPSKAHVKARKPNEKETGVSFGTYQWIVEMSGSPIAASTDPTTPTTGLVLFELIPYNVILNLLSSDPMAPASTSDGEIIIAIDFNIEFESGAGNIVYSNTYTYMLNLCYGCLAPTNNFSMIKMQCTDGYALVGNLCSPGQDLGLECIAATVK